MLIAAELASLLNARFSSQTADRVLLKRGCARARAGWRDGKHGQRVCRTRTAPLTR